MLKVLLSVNGRSGRDVKVYQVCKSVGRCSLKNDLPEETAVREKSLSCLLKVAKFWKLYSHRNCFKISLPLGGRSPSLLIASPPPPPPSLHYVSSGCANYLFIFILSLFSFIILSPSSPPPPFPCVCGFSVWSVACYHPLHALSCSRGVSIQTSASSCHINYYTE